MKCIILNPMSMQVSFKDILPPFRARFNEIAIRRLEIGTRTGFRDYSIELSALSRELLRESTKLHIEQNPETDFSSTFAVSAGSSGRDDLTAVSDIDFLAVPTDGHSIRTAKELRDKISLGFQMNESSSPFLFDHRFHPFYDYCKPPEQYPQELLMPTSDLYNDGQVVATDLPCWAHVVIRDFSFIHGNKDGFKELMETCTPRLFPYGDNGDLENGRLLIQQMITEADEIIRGWESDKSFDKGIKDRIRLLQNFKWIISARESIKDSKSFYEIIDRTSLIDPDEKEALKNTYENLLMVREARMLAKEKYKGNKTLENIVIGLEMTELGSRVVGDFDRCVEIIKEKLPQIL